MTSWGHCVECINVLGNHLFIRIIPGLLGLTCWDPSLKLLLPLRRRMSRKGALEKDLSRLLLRVRFSLIYIVDSFLGQWFIILVLASDDEFAPSFKKRWRIDWGGGWWSAEGTPRRCYQTPGVASWQLQYVVSEAVHSRSQSWELMEQVFDDGNNHVQMRNLLVLFLIDSKFYLIFAFWIISSPILLPLLCMPLGITLFVFVSLRQWGEKSQLLNPVWILRIPVGFVFEQLVVWV